jgi:long-chain acyl-CoA synthetase
MPNFLENIFAQLRRADGRVVLREIHGDRFASVTGRELLEQIQRVRAFLQGSGLQAGDRCALLAPNSIRWAAFHLAMMAEGMIVVPLYSRQASAELVSMMKDCQPRLLFTSDAALGEVAGQVWPGAPRRVLFDEILGQSTPHPPLPDVPNPRQDSDIVTIIYTSGTSGEPKGVCLTVGNLSHMLSCTTERLDQLVGATHEPDRVFHYLPFNFAASTILLLSCLVRESVLTLSTDLNRLADEIRFASPNYFLNVPTLLERVRRGVEDAISNRPAVIRSLFARARGAWQRQRSCNGRTVARARPPAYLWQDQRAFWSPPARVDLRIGAARPRDAAVLPHAGHSRIAGLWTYGNNRHLHSG